ncbi:ferric reductase like transmembrane component domain-containing protein [Hirsutella rhossiliensis]|uniref:Ferric reductase like transmembrane component domain-containing protein n=1 Tax=Hirsutella rhossiliensis TaxID=111463 RepID=A0A9P8MPM5_9HYPO|nr:ferric reductase like transmembrane component domain-containing protein [Hirsutella rhossiliensis]KAH0958920.1 ferric reductase like transmembrane component domain-containing protein [Hirsutella rhossiliensis]
MDATSINRLDSRHIQNHSDADAFELHWGYPNRVVPCKNDAGSCAYLDVVYNAHDLGMLYTGILWATLGAILLLSACLRNLGRPVLQAGSGRARGGLHKIRATLAALRRRYLLPDANHFLFGRTTRLQVSVLAILAGYLLVLSFAGIVYNTWVTPVKNKPGIFNTRTSLGPWSDRVGVLAYALTPLSVLLSSRESLLSVLTGLPYQTFSFLHRWLGYIIFVQSALHTVGWCIIQIRLYQPQPTVALEWVKQPYIVWGIVAMLLLTLMFVLSTPWAIRRTGYEFFRKAHYVLAMVYIGACWAHWEKLQCFLIPSLLLWGLDRGARFVRTALLQYHPWASDGLKPSFSSSQATMTRFSGDQHGDVIRLDLDNEQDPWVIGQHFYLCFAECSIWQSHPFTPLNVPVLRDGRVRHSYIVRAKSGETRNLAGLAARKQSTDESTKSSSYDPTTSVILTGPYGEDLMARVAPSHGSNANNIICVAGGTGIAYVLPVLLQLARQRPMPDRRVELIWAMRHLDNVDWVREEMDSLQRSQTALNLRIRLFATRDSDSTAAAKTDAATDSSSNNAGGCDDDLSVHRIGGTGSNRHPDLRQLLGDFVDSTISGRTTVFASGPGGMITDLRNIVASLNSPSKVWRRQERFDVDLVCDDRMEW